MYNRICAGLLSDIILVDTMLEKDIQKAIIEYLNYRGVFNWRNNSGAMKTEHSFVRFGAVGSPDVFAMQGGILYGIEVKTPKGVLSPYQKHWGELLEKAGGKYVVARSVDEVMAIFK